MDINDDMREQWNSIAQINAFYGVDSIDEFEKSNIDENLFYKRGAETVERFLEEIKLRNTVQMSMAEIGCGLGRMSHCFADKFGKVYSFDVSDEMIRRATAKFREKKNLEFILGSGSDLKPLNSSSVDFVFSFIVLQHVLTADIVLNYIKETGRVLKKNGIAFLQFRTYTPVKNENRFHLVKIFPRPLRKLIKGIIKPEHSGVMQNDDYKSLDEKYSNEYKVWHGCSVNIYDAKKTFAKAGLKLVKVEGVNSQYTFFTLVKG